MTPFKKLFVPVDGSDLAERAMQTSVALAKQMGAAITAFIAEPDVPLPSVKMQMSQYEKVVDRHVERTDGHARDLLSRFEMMAAEQGVDFHSLHARTDSVDQAIVDQAEASGCDMIVMVTHGRSTVGEWIYGSHTKKVLALSKLPVLVLH